jgi:hypothetical protein
MTLLRKTLVMATLTWLPIVVLCAILLCSGDSLRCLAVGAWLALPGWPALFAVLLPMLGIGEMLAEARTPTPVPAPARGRNAGR